MRGRNRRESGRGHADGNDGLRFQLPMQRTVLLRPVEEVNQHWRLRFFVVMIACWARDGVVECGVDD
jgi:hypothetical protein